MKLNPRVLELIQYLQLKSPYYRRIFSEKKIQIEHIQTEADFHTLPFTGKEDIASFNTEFLCVPKSDVADFVTTSGTLGEPVTFFLTKKDLERLAENEAFSMRVADGTENDIYQLMTTIDKRFMAGLAYYLGIQKMNAGMVRVGPGAPYLQWDSIHRISPTVLIAIPSFIPRLIDFAEEHHIDYKRTHVRSIVCIGEPIRNPDFSLNELGEQIKSRWDVALYSTYASTEMSTSFTECRAGQGGHLNEDLIYLEVIREDGKPAREGEAGEVVISTLGVEGMPLLRYQTGDICHVYYSPCKCGRTSTRLGPVIGRKKQMLKYKGTTFFPSSIINTLAKCNILENYLIEITRDHFNNDTIAILLPNEMENQAEILNQLTQSFKAAIRVVPRFKFISLQHLQILIQDEKDRKPKRLLDNR